MIRKLWPTLLYGQRWLLRFYLTDTGCILLIGMFLAGMITILFPTHHIVSCLVILITLAAVIGAVYWPRLTITGPMPRRIIAGIPVTLTFNVTNRAKLPAYDLALSLFDLPRPFKEIDPNRFIPILPSGQTTPYEIKIKPLQRGQYFLKTPLGYSTFPFNIFRSGSARRKSSSVLVLPNFYPLNRVNIAHDMRYHPGGVVHASKIGESPEYIGNREFQTGDSPRNIDTHAWARLAQPIVREYHEEYYCHVALVMDTFIHPRRRPGQLGFPDFEAAVSLTAALADNISHSERIIDFFAAGPDLYVFRTGRNTAHIENLLDILACLDPSRNNPYDKIAPALTDELYQTSSIIFIMLDWDLRREKLLRLALEAGCSVRVLIIRDGETSYPTQTAQSRSVTFTHITPTAIQNGELQEL